MAVEPEECPRPHCEPPREYQHMRTTRAQVGSQSPRAAFRTVSLPLYIWAAGMLAVSSLPGQALPEIGLWQWDKFAHAFEYAVFAYLLCRFLSRRGALPLGRIVWLCLAIGIGYGVVDELHKIFIPMRACTWQDLVADGAGIGLGILAAVRRLGGKQTP